MLEQHIIFITFPHSNVCVSGLSAESLKGRVVEVSLGDLKNNAEDEAFRKFKLRVEEVCVCASVVPCVSLFSFLLCVPVCVFMLTCVCV